jgi:hypothetical protein
MQTVTHAPSSSPISYHAHFDGLPDSALRDSAGACWFLADDGTATLLHHCDAPFLTLLGWVDLAHEQRILDDLAGSLYELVDHRNSHHAHVAA